MPHRARCPACKANVEVLLRTLYGGVESNWASGWPCTPDGLEASPVRPVLTAIHGALVAHRGHAGFVRSRRLPRCDFYVPPGPHGPGFLVEYDEEQHFTAPRALSLAGVPAGHPVAFDLVRWRDLANSMNKHDNDPAFRDEQRAWYDVLRDVLPAEHGLGPTSRLLDREIAYCGLDPKNAHDLATFETMLNRPRPPRIGDPRVN